MHLTDDQWRLIEPLFPEPSPFARGRPPFNPREAVKRFANVLREFRVSRVSGDAYGGQQYRLDFQDEGVLYEVTPYPKAVLYEFLEATLNTHGVELPDRPKLQEQLLGGIEIG